MNYCGFNIEPFCSDVCGDHRCPQTLAEIHVCRNMGICCGFRAVAARGKYLGFILLPSGECCKTSQMSTLVQVMAWCSQVTSHYLSQCWPRSMSPYPSGLSGQITLKIDIKVTHCKSDRILRCIINFLFHCQSLLSIHACNHLSQDLTLKIEVKVIVTICHKIWPWR